LERHLLEVALVYRRNILLVLCLFVQQDEIQAVEQEDLRHLVLL
jgi:hypothetical protein